MFVIQSTISTHTARPSRYLGRTNLPSSPSPPPSNSPRSSSEDKPPSTPPSSQPVTISSARSSANHTANHTIMSPRGSGNRPQLSEVLRASNSGNYSRPQSNSPSPSSPPSPQTSPQASPQGSVNNSTEAKASPPAMPSFAPNEIPLGTSPSTHNTFAPADIPLGTTPPSQVLNFNDIFNDDIPPPSLPPLPPVESTPSSPETSASNPLASPQTGPRTRPSRKMGFVKRSEVDSSEAARYIESVPMPSCFTSPFLSSIFNFLGHFNFLSHPFIGSQFVCSSRSLRVNQSDPLHIVSAIT